MAHPRRLSTAHSLAESVGAEVVADPLPDAAPSPLRTAVLAWGSAPSAATHVLVLQDDVRLTAGFVTRAAQAARTFPDAAIAFYANWDSYNGAVVRLAASAGARWVTSVGNEYTPCLALLLPARYATGFAAFAIPLLAEMREDDKAMARYLRREGVRTILSVPALVEHQGEISIANNDRRELRRAACFMAAAPPLGPADRLLTDHRTCPYYRDGGSHSLLLGETGWDWERGATRQDALRSWGTAREPVRTRREEDLDAMRALGVTALHGRFLDAIYRRDDAGRWLIGEGAKASSVLGADESVLVESIEHTVGELIAEHRPALVLTCSALGNHVDHVRARDAAVRAAAEAGIAVRLWEDLPYGLWTRERRPLPLRREWGPPVLTDSGEDAWKAKTDAVSRYASQLAMLRQGDTPILEQLDRHGRTFASGSTRELAWAVT